MIQKAMRGRIFTFYSYKGGTGRSMLVANTGWLLANAGYHVLMVDWDLEAPGLHRYMAPFLTDPQMTDSNGLIDLVVSYATEAVEPADKPRAPEWIRDRADVLDYAVSINWKFGSGGTLSLLPAGRQGSAYATKVNSFSWQNFYDRLGGYTFFEALKDSMRANFDFILIDSRTGVSDTAGICTVQFPDSLVVCFTLNNQSIEGAAAVARSVRDQKQDPDFKIFPVPTRLDNSESDKLLDRWQLAKDRFSELLPANQRSRYWDELAILYVPKFAYEEVLAVFANRPDDPSNLNLLAHSKRLTETLVNGEVPLHPMEESIRSNVLAHFAGKAVDLSPMEAQKAADEERARLEAARRKLEAEKTTLIEAARSEGKQEAEVVMAATVKKARMKLIVAFVGLAILVFGILAGRQVYNQSRISAARDAAIEGDLARLEKRWDNALDSYSRALRVLADDATLYSRRAGVLIELSRPADALKDLDKAVELEPENLEGRGIRGQTRFAVKDYKGAIEDLSFVVSRDPESITATALLADAYESNNQTAEAIKTYTLMLDKFPGSNDADTLLRRANLYLKEQDRDSAVRDYRTVVKSMPTSPSAVYAEAQLKTLGVSPGTVTTPVRTVVYIQYSDDAGKAMITSLRSSLQKEGFQAPAGESRQVKTNGEIRYFHREDADRASRVKKAVEVTLAERRYLVDLQLRLMDPKQFPNVPMGQVEVWLPQLTGYDIQQRVVPEPRVRR